MYMCIFISVYSYVIHTGKHIDYVSHVYQDNDATFYTNLAAAHFALQDYPNTIKVADMALRVDPRNVKAFYRSV